MHRGSGLHHRFRRSVVVYALCVWALATTAFAQAALLEAVAVGSYAEIEAVLNAVVEPEVHPGSDGPLHVAAWSRDGAIVELLVRHGFDVDVRGDGDRTPLMLAAAFNRDLDVIAAFVTAGADLEARDAEGYTPLLLALRWSDRPEVVARLLEAGANASAVAYDGTDAWTLALANPALDPSALESAASAPD